MIIACLLHDISYAEEFRSKEDWMNHGRRSAEIIKPFLDSLTIDQELKEEILYGIAIHVDDQVGYDGERTNFTETIVEADHIDRFDMVRLNQYICDFKLHTPTLTQQISFVEHRIMQLKKLKK